MAPVGAAEQTGVAAGGGELGCGQPEGKEGGERTGEDVFVEWGGRGRCGGAEVCEWVVEAVELKEVLCF